MKLKMWHLVAYSATPSPFTPWLDMNNFLLRSYDILAYQMYCSTVYELFWNN